MEKSKQLDVIQLAMKIADEYSRSVIELYADLVAHGDEYWYDVDSPLDPELIPAAEAEEAISYLGMRGEGLPFLMVRHEKAANLIRFEPRA
jgi:hypothetical protein